MSRLALFAAAAVLAAGSAQAQRVDIAAQLTGLTRPYPVQPGQLVSGEIAPGDYVAGPDWNGDVLVLSLRAGEAVTAQLKSDIPGVELHVHAARSHTGKALAEGPASAAPLRFVAPSAGDYLVFVHAKGPQRFGKYLLALGSDQGAPSFGPPSPAPAQLAPQPAAAVVSVDPARWTAAKPVPVRPGELVAGEISPVDIISGVERSGDVLLVQGRAGETITLQVRSDIPSLLVAVRMTRSTLSLKPLLEGPARDAPIRFVVPKDDTYQIVVHTVGPNRYGKYLLAIGTDQGAPPFDPPKPAPVQVAQAAPEPAAPPKPAAPLVPPPLPKIPGVTVLAAGKDLARPAGKPGAGPEMFEFLAAAGSELFATVTGAGPITVRLYTIDGAEILAASGTAIVRLDAIAPRDDLYFLSVARRDPAKPYRLKLAEKEVDVLTALARYPVGYEELGDRGQVARTSCWLEPGVSMRRTYPDGRVAQVTYLGAGRSRAVTEVPGKPNTTVEWTNRLDGEVVVQTFASGQSTRFRPFGARVGAYRGYLCP